MTSIAPQGSPSTALAPSDWTSEPYSLLFARLLARDPDLPGLLAAHRDRPLTADAIAALWAACRPADGLPPAPQPALKAALRRLRNRCMAIAMERDLAGLAPVEEITAAMTALAELAVGEAYRYAAQDLARDVGQPVGAASGQVQELLVVGMGKLGGGELNVSSDIDLVLLYPEDGDTAGGATPRRLSNHEFFGRVARSMTALLTEQTEDGFVFRVDLRLRPEGDAGPVALPLAALEPYFVMRGRDWERYAWVKARVLPVAAFDGTEAVIAEAVQDLESVRIPFVYRKYLDFDALAALRDLRSRITDELSRRSVGAGWAQAHRLNDVKLGQGGIREIEFVAQVFQLIRGGRLPALRVRPTLAALAETGRLNLLSAETVAELTQAYRFLRRAEHRLQYVDDQQTHTLPTDPAAQAKLAQAMGCADWAEFEAELSGHRETVHGAFDDVLGDMPGKEEEDLPEWRTQLLGRFPREAEEWIQTVEAWFASGKAAALPERTRQRLESIVGVAVSAVLSHSERANSIEFDPQRALVNTLRLFETISRRSSYIALLAEYPHVMERVVKVMGTSDWATQYVLRHPILLDELLDDGMLAERAGLDQAKTDWAYILASVRDNALGKEAEDDTERLMNGMREFHHQRVFHLVLQDLEGMHTVEHLADRLSEEADLVLDIALPLCWQQLRQRHGETPHFAIVGYGKLGAKEMGFGSDLDLVFLYDDPDPRAREQYVRLAQRLSTWLTTMTAAGRLYEIDLRLRPDGESGLLVSAIDAFEQYQRSSAWTWEHQALTRARFCAGDRAVGRRFEAFRRELLALPRDAAKLREEVLAMRQKMRAAKRPQAGVFDVKHDDGGMVDLEFCVQYLVLAHGHAHAPLLDNAGAIALLGRAAHAGFLPFSIAMQAIDAYRALRKVQHRARMRTDTKIRVPDDQLVEERQAVRALWAAVFGG
jgi:glutamate-ammonia-ligase adenylyltransferase